MKNYGYLLFFAGFVAFETQQSAWPLGIVSIVYALPLTMLASQLFRFKYRRIKYNSLGAAAGVYVSEIALGILITITIGSSLQTNCTWIGRYTPCNTGLLWGGGFVALASFLAGSIINYQYYRKKLIEWK